MTTNDNEQALLTYSTITWTGTQECGNVKIRACSL